MAEKLFTISFKDTDPDTGEITRVKKIATVLCEPKVLDYILHSLSIEDDPNRDYEAEEVANEFIKI